MQIQTNGTDRWRNENKHCLKRVFDFGISLIGILALSPVFLLLIVMGAVKMKGNPFFVQKRPGYRERIFKLIKFRTMTNERDKNGVLLPDSVRLTSYGRFLRKTSLDELPEFLNILIGDMAIVGPRPLLVKYLDRYNAEQHRRHEVRPGLTGYTQVHGRNLVAWADRFQQDVWYVDHLSLKVDIGILLTTVKMVLAHEGISSATAETMEEFMGNG